MSSTRREFLKGGAWFGASTMVGGCATRGGLLDFTQGAPMQGWAAPRMPHVRLGVVGMGIRGCGVVGRVCNLPGVNVTSICDNVPAKIAKVQKMLADKKRSAAKEYLGDDAWRQALRRSERRCRVQYDTVGSACSSSARRDELRQARVHRGAERVHRR